MLARVLLPSHDCATCTDALKKQRGCDAPPPMPVSLDGEELDRCPVRPYKDDPGSFDDVLQAYSWFKAGMLPDPGTVLDQAEPFLAAVSVLDKAVRGAQEARAKKSRAAAERDRDLRSKVPQKRSAQPAKSGRRPARRYRPGPKPGPKGKRGR